MAALNLSTVLYSNYGLNLLGQKTKSHLLAIFINHDGKLSQKVMVPFSHKLAKDDCLIPKIDQEVNG